MRSRFSIALGASLAFAACSSDPQENTAGAPATGSAGSGAAAAAPEPAQPGGAAAGSGGGAGGRAGAAGAGASTSAGTNAAGAPAAGSGGASGSVGATGGTGAAGAAGTAGPAPGPSARPTECHGMPMPPRALGKNPPFAIGPEAAGLPPYWPTTEWRMETPDKLGFDAAKLEQALAFTTQYANTQAILVVRHGYIAAEKYFGTFTATTTHESFSMAKSFTSGLIGIAIAEGKLSGVDYKICDAYPMEWDCADTSDPRSRISVDHAMNLTTGLRWKEDWRSTATGTNDATRSLNMLDTVLAREAVEEPGTNKRYSTGDPALLSGVLQKATGMTALQYAKQKLFDVIGTPNIRWNQDNKGRTTTYAGMQATARDFAKYGYLYLNRGQWDGKQVVSADWVEKTTQATQPCDDWNQYLWHVNLPIRLGAQDPACASSGKSFCTPTDIANVPPEAFTAKGINGQFVMVVPSADLVIVRFGADMPGSERWDQYARGLLEGVLDAIR